MAYRMLEELQNRRKEKVAIFLTFENIVGLIIVFFPVFLGTSAFPLLIHGPLCIGAAILGVMATVELHGLPIYEHALWRVRGELRLRTQGRVITPAQLTGTVVYDAPERPLPLDGPIHAVAHAGRPQSGRWQRHAQQARSTRNGHRVYGADHADL